MSQITTHILDTARGVPAAGVRVALAQWRDGAWAELGAGISDADGRVAALLPPGETLPAGECKLTFATADYHRAAGAPGFYPRVEIAFCVAAGGAHYHIPLLLGPFGYTTYRGS